MSLRCWSQDVPVLAGVRDTGEGIPPQVEARLFEPFMTTKEAGKGTGLGLSICYRIIKEHGGYIRAVTAAGKGTEMIVDLPAAVVPEAVVAARSAVR